MSVNNRNVWNKDKWTRLKLFKIGNKDSLYLRETFETLKGRLTDLFFVN